MIFYQYGDILLITSVSAFRSLWADQFGCLRKNLELSEEDGQVVERHRALQVLLFKYFLLKDIYVELCIRSLKAMLPFCFRFIRFCYKYGTEPYQIEGSFTFQKV